MNKDSFKKQMETEGMVLVENVISADLIEALKKELQDAIFKEKQFHGTENYQDYGMVLMCAKYGGELLKIFENDEFFKPFEWVLGEDCIAYSNTSSSMPPNKSNYSKRVHADAPVEYPNEYLLRMLSLVVLDDFSEENGATWFLPRSHNLSETPSDEFFFENAKRLKAKAGSVLYWNPRVWHAGGDNHTENWRHAFTIVMTRKFIKQRLDIPKLLDLELGKFELSDNAMQRLGYKNIPPASYKEYYGYAK